MRGQETLAARFFVSAKATVVQTPDLFDILRDMLLTVKLDNRDRFRQIVLKSKARRESSLVPSGHAYVRDRLRAGLTTAGWADEPVSYTHLDVYKRQPLHRGKRRGISGHLL